MAALDPTTLPFEVPERWILVGTWAPPRQPFTADDIRFLFALQPEGVAPRRAHLDEFSTDLPDGVACTPNGSPAADRRRP